MPRSRATPSARSGMRRRAGRARRDWPVAALAAAGLALSAYLAVVYATGTQTPLCTEGSGCDVVRSSRYAALAGVPVPLIGVAGYGALLALALLGGRLRPTLLPLGVMGALGFTAYLQYVELAVLRALCVYCVASAGLVAALAALTLVRAPRYGLSPARLGLLGAAVALVVGLGAAGLARIGTPSAEAEWTEGLARHLAAQGAVMYGAYWCPHCAEQKAMFGDAAGLLPYVECDPGGKEAQPQVCQAKGVRGYPTWEIAGTLYEGVQPLTRLAWLTGYPPPPEG